MLRNTALALAAASLLLGGGALTPAFANYSQCDEQPNAEGCRLMRLRSRMGAP